MKVNFKTLLIGLFGFFWILTATIAVALAAVRFYAWPGSVITWKETPGMSGGFVEVR